MPLVPAAFFSSLTEQFRHLAEKARKLTSTEDAVEVQTLQPHSNSPEAYFKTPDDMEMEFSLDIHHTRLQAEGFPTAYEVYYSIMNIAEINGLVHPEQVKGLMEENY